MGRRDDGTTGRRDGGTTGRREDGGTGGRGDGSSATPVIPHEVSGPTSTAPWPWSARGTVGPDTRSVATLPHSCGMTGTGYAPPEVRHPAVPPSLSSPAPSET